MVEVMLMLYDFGGKIARGVGPKRYHVIPRVGDYLETKEANGGPAIYRIIAFAAAEYEQAPTAGDLFAEQVGYGGPQSVVMYLNGAREHALEVGQQTVSEN